MIGIKNLKLAVLSGIALMFLFAFSNKKSDNSDKWLTKTGKITFKSTADEEIITAVSNQAGLVFSQTSGNIVVSIPIKSFIFEKKLMQTHFNENYMESGKYPNATFSGIINKIGTINFGKDTTYDVSCTGQLTMHGQTKPLVIKGTIKISKNANALINCNFDVKLADYKIDRPKLMLKKIAENINITLESDCSKFAKK